MTAPHGPRYGYPGAVVGLFKCNDNVPKSFEGNQVPILATAYAEGETSSYQEPMNQATTDLGTGIADSSSHQNADFPLPQRGVSTSASEARSSEAPDDFGSPLATGVLRAHTPGTKDNEFERPDEKQHRKGGKRLTRDQRRDILLMRRLGHKYEDIAKFLGVTQSAVQYTVNSGRASPEHHKAGRKKAERPEIQSVPRHANGRRIRKDVGSSKKSSRSTVAERTDDAGETTAQTQHLGESSFPGQPPQSTTALHPLPN